MTVPALAKACGGTIHQRGRAAKRIHTDSRSTQRGDCFVALAGERFDAHEFLPEVIASRPAGLIVGRGVEDCQVPEGTFVIQVEDTENALGSIAAEHRRRHSAKVIGITGSCGKTSTKDMLGSILASRLKAIASPGSFNNQVGVPLSLLQISKDSAAAVIEVGSNSPGEIAALTKIVAPDIGIITCIGEAHLSGLGDIRGVAQEKASLIAGLSPDGTAILNADDASCRKIAEDTDCKTVLVRVNQEADWFATDVSFHGLGTSFLLQGERPVTLQRLGSHNVYNALLSIAAAAECGMSLDDILAAICSQEPSARRMESRCAGDVTLFDDTYNMNPISARAALVALAGLQGKGRRVVVFGEMHELGEQSDQLHERLGREVAAADMDYLLTVGERASSIAEAAIAEGMPARSVEKVDDLSSALQHLLGVLKADDRVLCKASRAVGLDRLVDELSRRLELGENPSPMDV
ncbi:MAG: UDP-N-acetylmuramoyl-tripeptide--D-alanyl-D-alanine ligase [Planctomycetota bacterium]|jgi:UDP-N-acetylmuramoyl-tripeptide--D-alanyl-D-alanine ligase